MKVTLEGRRFLLAILFVALAAFNTGNNLMYLIFSMMLSLLFVSFIVPYINLHGINVSIELEEPVFAKTPITLILRYINKKRHVSSYSFRFLIPVLGDVGFYIEKIVPGEKTRVSHKIQFPKRGLYKIKDTLIITEFPFIFFSFKKMPGGTTRVFVYPQIYDVRNKINEIITVTEGHSKPKIGSGDDLFKIRYFSYGDEMRDIHWKATARTGEVMVKEFSRDEPKKVTVVLDNLRYESTRQFEKAISFTASIASELVNSNFTVRLVTCKKTIPFGSGIEHLYKILDVLAIIDQFDKFDCPSSIKSEIEGITVLILSSENSMLRSLSFMASKVYYATTL